jgi:uncharacterized protein with GYD domain
MAKYLFTIRITAQGANNDLPHLGTGFELSLRDIVNQAGGTVDQIYFTLGETDIFLIADLPAIATAAALAATIVAGTHAIVRTIPIFEVADIELELGKGWQWLPPATWRGPGT